MTGKNDILIAPSILSADFSSLEKEIDKVEKAGADWIHVDVMDGHFVPNITIGPLVVEALKRITKLPLDVHLMIENPEKFVETFKNAGADIITLHYEASDDIRGMIDKIKNMGIKAGVSIKPGTSAEDIFEVTGLLDLVLVMTVEPGFGGQKFMSDMVPKISSLRRYINEKGIGCHIEVDGGIDSKTAPTVVKAGADVLVAGNAVFKSTNPALAIRDIRNSLK